MLAAIDPNQMTGGNLYPMKTVLIANQKGGCGKTQTAITLASALANKGYKVTLADADQQKSSLQWLKLRPESAAPISAVDWREESSIGSLPKKTDWLIIDAPGALSGEQAEQLIAESDALLVPVQPSFFDIDSTRRFLKKIDDVKRIRKGKVAIHLIANRMKTGSTSQAHIQQFFDKIEQQPIAWIAERSSYPLLAMEGLSIFDRQQKPYLIIQQQWQPILRQLLGEDVSKRDDWF